jgi:hypothetical protein
MRQRGGKYLGEEKIGPMEDAIEQDKETMLIFKNELVIAMVN